MAVHAAGEVGGELDAGRVEMNGVICVPRKPVLYGGTQKPRNKDDALLATIEMWGKILQKENCQLASLGAWGLAA